MDSINEIRSGNDRLPCADIYKDALFMLNQGIVILDSNQTILLWNSYMVNITGIGYEDIVGRSIYEALPKLDRNFFRQAVDGVLKSGYKYFFSAAIHGSILDSDEKMNLKISLLNQENPPYLLFEFINVTDEFVRVNQLKQDIYELHHLNQELKKKERIIKHLAYFDGQTGVGNRTLFYMLAEKYIQRAEKKQEIVAFMFVDVDQFKLINDTYGHVAGDKVIVKVADVLNKATRKMDIVTRYGGDEFIILLPRIQSPEEVITIEQAIRQYKDTKMEINGDTVEISMSIGVSLFPLDGSNIDQLLVKADSAMYADKRKGTKGSSFISISYRDMDTCL